MSELQELIKYLNPNKHKADNFEREKFRFIQINQAYVEYLEDIQNNDIDFSDLTVYISYKAKFKSDDAYTELSQNVFNLPLYLDVNSSTPDYYFGKQIDGVTKFITLDQALSQENGDAFYQEYTLDLVYVQTGENLYYNKNQRNLYTVQAVPQEIVFKFRRSLHYNPNELPGLRSKEYILDYVDPRGQNARQDRLDKSLGGNQANQPYENKSDINKLLTDRNKRKVYLSLSPEKGELNWFPEIIVGSEIVLKYTYHRELNENEELKSKPYAILLQFSHPLSFLAFVKLVYFDNGVSLYKYSMEDQWKTKKREFFQQYIKVINSILKTNSSPDQKLIYLYFVPGEVFSDDQNLFPRKQGSSNNLGVQFLWDILDETLKGPVTNLNLKKENIVLNILLSIQKAYQRENIQSSSDEIIIESGDTSPSTQYKPQSERIKEINSLILDKLLKPENGHKEGRIITLMYRIDGKNFQLLNDIMRVIWMQSTYFDPNNPIFHETIQDKDGIKYKYDGPLKLLYNSKNILGFFSDNIGMDWVDNNSKLKMSLYTRVLKKNRTSGPIRHSINSTPLTLNFNYHPFQPIYILNPKKQTTSLTMNQVMPAFYLKAIQIKNFTSNIFTAIDYALDIWAIVSGFGALRSFRYLARLAKRASSIPRFAGAARYANVIATIKFTAGTLELTSSAANIMFRVTNSKNSALAKAMSEYLFWMEIAVQPLELLEALQAKARNSAKSVLEQEKELLQELNKMQIEEKGILRKLTHEEKSNFMLTLDQVATGGKSLNRRIIKDLKRGRNVELLDEFGRILETGKKLDLLKIRLKEIFDVRVRFVEVDPKLRSTKNLKLENGEELSKLEFWNRTGTVGSFVEGPKPEFFVRYNYGSKLTIVSELRRMENWFTKRTKANIALEEYDIFGSLWDTRVKYNWTDAELLNRFEYTLRTFKDEIQRLKNVNKAMTKQLEDAKTAFLKEYKPKLNIPEKTYPVSKTKEEIVFTAEEILEKAFAVIKEIKWAYGKAKQNIAALNKISDALNQNEKNIADEKERKRLNEIETPDYWSVSFSFPENAEAPNNTIFLDLWDETGEPYRVYHRDAVWDIKVTEEGKYFLEQVL